MSLIIKIFPSLTKKIAFIIEMHCTQKNFQLFACERFSFLNVYWKSRRNEFLLIVD